MKKVHVLFASIAVIAIIATINAATQDPGSLDRRISMLEQRFFRLESSMTRLEQVVVSQRSVPAQTGREQDFQLMRQELEGLKLRMNEIECGLVKLDERTTPANARKDSNDQCRLNPGARLRLSTRP